ncbi:hypothetical protein BU15DRAFT_19257, partial [Melanogaster broomeanus]
SDVFNLCCWVRGTDVDTSFVITVSRTGTVNALKTLLKESQPNKFRDVDAADLRLYKPRHPVAKPYDENLSSVVLSELGKPLSAWHELSEVFAVPPPTRHIHIIV